MKVILTIDSVHAFEIDCSDIATLIRCLPNDLPHAIMFSRLFDHPSSEVRCAIADMDFMLSNVLEILARDSCLRVVSRVASNQRALKNFQSPLILEMINRDVNIALDIAENLSWIQDDVRVKVVQALLLNTDPTVVEITQEYMKGESQWRRGDNPPTFNWDDSTEEDEWQEP